MATLLDIYLKKESINELVKAIRAYDMGGIRITIAANDDTNKYGNNTSAWISQSRESREANEPKTYVGNGKVFWTDGKVVLAERKDEPKPPQGDWNYPDKNVDDELPF